MSDSNRLRACTLFSGSGGNSSFIEYNGVALMIDAGVSERRLSAALASVGSDWESVVGIFVTHEHIDHIGGLQTICKRHKTPVHMTEQSARCAGFKENSSVFDCLCVYPPHFAVREGPFVITSFITPHDSALCVGYIIEAGGVKIGYFTDAGRVTDEMKLALRGCDYAVIESNHDEDMLLCGGYSYELKRRILSPVGHLSNSDAAELAQYLAENGTKRIVLAHISGENNYPEIAVRESENRTARCNIEIAAAREGEITVIV